MFHVNKSPESRAKLNHKARAKTQNFAEEPRNSPNLTTFLLVLLLRACYRYSLFQEEKN